MSAEPLQEINPERAMLGAILDGWRGDLDDLGIRDADFTDPAMGTVWDVVRRVGRDPLTVQRALVDTTVSRLPGFASLVPSLRAEACVPGSVEYYASIVAADADRRALANAGLRIHQLAGAQDRDPDELIEQARTTLDEIGSRSTGELADMSDVMAEATEAAEHPEHGIPWPWDINDRMMPIAKGRVYVIAARPSSGKSIAGQNIAVDAARRGLPVAFASLEMSRRELGQRMAAQVGTLELSRITRGTMSEQDWTRYAQACEHLRGLPLHIDETASQTVTHIRRHARNVKRHYTGKLGMVVVDYLQLITPSDSRQERRVQVDQVSRDLHIMARDLDVPVIALAQLNRGSLNATDKRPTIGQLRESGGIEQDADVVVLLHRDDEEVPGQLEWIVPKQRNGPNGFVCNLSIAGHHARIE